MRTVGTPVGGLDQDKVHRADVGQCTAGRSLSSQQVQVARALELLVLSTGRRCCLKLEEAIGGVNQVLGLITNRSVR